MTSQRGRSTGIARARWQQTYGDGPWDHFLNWLALSVPLPVFLPVYFLTLLWWAALAILLAPLGRMRRSGSDA